MAMVTASAEDRLRSRAEIAKGKREDRPRPCADLHREKIIAAGQSSSARSTGSDDGNGRPRVPPEVDGHSRNAHAAVVLAMAGALAPFPARRNTGIDLAL